MATGPRASYMSVSKFISSPYLFLDRVHFSHWQYGVKRLGRDVQILSDLRIDFLDSAHLQF